MYQRIIISIFIAVFNLVILVENSYCQTLSSDSPEIKAQNLKGGKFLYQPKFNLNDKRDLIESKLIITISDVEEKDSARYQIKRGEKTLKRKFLKETKALTFRPKLDENFSLSDKENSYDILIDNIPAAKLQISPITKNKDPNDDVNEQPLDVKIRQAAEAKVQVDIIKEKLRFDTRSNLNIKNNEVFIYIDEFGRFIKSGLPTTAKESYIYHFKVAVCTNCHEKAAYFLDVDGVYKPQFNIDNTGENISEQQSTVGFVPDILLYDFGTFGPFTDNFTVKLTKRIDNNSNELLNKVINVAKLYHVSISTGLFSTSLNNPQNIVKVPMVVNGNVSTDSTLVADDPNWRGVLTIMATYYPTGRSFLFPPSGGALDPSRFGVIVGAQLNQKIEENFFGGLSFDFARGGSVALGAHFGRRNYITGGDYKNFDFGNERFVGNLIIKKKWDLGIFIGVIIDTRVAFHLLSSLGGRTP